MKKNLIVDKYEELTEFWGSSKKKSEQVKKPTLKEIELSDEALKNLIGESTYSTIKKKITEMAKKQGEAWEKSARDNESPEDAEMFVFNDFYMTAYLDLTDFEIGIYAGLGDDSGHQSSIFVNIKLAVKKIDYEPNGING